MESIDIRQKLTILVILSVLVLTAPAMAGTVIPDDVSSSNPYFITVANDAGAGANLYGNNTYAMVFHGGSYGMAFETDALYDSTDSTGENLVSDTGEGSFYLNFYGGRGGVQRVILMLAVNGTIPDDFRAHIRTSGYKLDYSEILAERLTALTPDNISYEDPGIDEYFTKSDFIYGPQVTRPPATTAIYHGQDTLNTDDTFQILFIDTGLGIVGNRAGSHGTVDNTVLTNTGKLKVDYSFENLGDGMAVIDAYGWLYSGSDSPDDLDPSISWTNLQTTDGEVRVFVEDEFSSEPPAASFTANVTSGEAPLAVQFTDASSGSPTTWAWDFENDGAVDSTEQNPVHTYETAGSYTVNLTVGNAAGSDSEVKTEFITATPSSATIELPQQNGLNLTVINKQRPGLYDSEHPGTYFFNIGNNIYNGGQNAIHISESYLTADGTITVSDSPTGTFYITDTGGKGYEDEAVLLIAVQENELSPDFSIDLTVEGYRFIDHAANAAPTADEVGTFNSEAYVATLTASDFLTYDGGTVSQAWKPSTGSAGDVNMKFFDGQDLAGPKYNLILVDLNTSIVGRNAPYRTTLTNYGNPKVTYSVHGYSGGNMSFAPYAYVSYQTGGGSYFDRTVGWASRSSTNSWLVTLPEAGTAPVANFTANVTSGDAPLAVQFTDASTGSPTAWAWDFENDGVVDSTERSPTHIYETAGTYTVNLTVANAAGSDTEVKTDYITVTMPGGSRLADSPMPKFGVNAQNTGQSTYDGPQTATIKWTVPIGEKISSYAGPAIASDGTIYIGTLAGTMHAMNPDGSIKWNFTTGGQIISTPALCSDGTIYFGSKDDKFYAVNPDGTEKWTYTPRGGDINSPAVGSDGTVYFTSSTTSLKYVYALNPVDGSEKWTFDPHADTTGNYIFYSTPVISPDGTIYINYGDLVYALDADGSKKWVAHTSTMYNSPVIGSDGTIHIATKSGGRVRALNSIDGSEKWTYSPYPNEFGYSSPVIASDGTIYAAYYNTGKVIAVNPDGSEKWTCTDINKYVYATPVIGSDGTIYLGSYISSSTSGDLFAINPDGTIKWKYSIPLLTGCSPAIDSDGTLYIGSKDGNVYAFENVVDFTTDAREVEAGQTSIQFTGSSGRTVSEWRWDFGDGTTSTERNPSHLYGSAGTFTVNLTVTEESTGEMFTASKPAYITVRSKPVADFTANVTSGDAPLAVQFTDASTGNPTSWAWDFENDGVVDSTEQNPQHTYTTEGTYTVNLTVTNAAGSDAEVKTDYITVTGGGSGGVAPVANFTANVTSGKVPLDVQFTDASGGSPTSWAWDFGDGTTATEQNPAHAYNAIGEYDVSLTATNADGSDTATKTNYIVVTGTGPTPLPAGQSLNLYVANDEGVKYNVENGVTNPASYTPYVFINNTYHFLYNGQGGGTNALHVSNDPSVTAGQVTTTTDQSGEFWFTFTGGQPNLHDAVLLLAVNGTIPDDFSVRIRSSGYDFEPPIPSVGNNNTIGEPVYVDGAINQTFTKEDFIYGPQIWRPHRVSDYPVFVGQDMSDAENTFQLMFIDLRLGCTQTKSDGYIKVEYEFDNLNSFAVFNGYGWYSASNHGTGLIMTTSGSEYQVVGEAGGDAPVANFTANVTSGKAPLAVQFTDASSGSPTSWAWDFENDGVVDSTEQNPAHIYETAGTYTVNLTATNAAGSNATTKADYITVSSPDPQPLSDWRNINIRVANDEGVKYDEPDGITRYADIGIPYNYVPNTYFVLFGTTGGGMNPMDISTDPSVKSGQVTRTTDQSGEFWVTFSGGQPYMHEGILMLAVNGTIPDDFSVRIRSSGYDFEPPIPSVGNNNTISEPVYVEGAINQTFTREDFIYGPQIWRPSSSENFPIYNGQDMNDAENTFRLMFIDLDLGATQTGTDNGAIRVEYQFNNLTTFAVFDAYGWYRASNHGTGIIMTNSGSEYAVIGDDGGDAPVADFTAARTSGDAPLAVQFTDASSGSPTTWFWDFENDGVVDSTEQNPSHTYTTAGVYTVNLTVANTAGTDSEVKTEYITVGSGRVLTSINLSPGAAELKVGGRQKFTAKPLDQQGHVMSGIDLAWASENETVGTVDGAGMFTALSPGETTITVSNESVRSTANVLVRMASGDQGQKSTIDVPGCNITENANGTTTISLNTSATDVEVGANEIVVRNETYTLTITTEGSPEVNNGTVNGTIAGIRLDTAPVVTDLGEAGRVSAGVGANLTGIPSGAGLDVTISENVSTDARSAFELAASQDGLTVDAVAYVMNVNKTNLVNGADIADATIRMSVSTAWVAAHGGNTSIQIIRWAEDGTKEVLQTRSLGFEGDMEIFEAISPSGLSLFGIASAPVQAAPPSPSTTSATSSSTGGGGRSAIGVSAAESIKAGGTATLTFDETSITEIEVRAQKDIPQMLVTATAGEMPDDADDLDGDVYEYVSIGCYKAPEGSLQWATIRFTVPAAWVDERVSSPDRLSLYRYDEETEEWVRLSTVFAGGENGGYAYYADSASFGYFAIVVKPDVKEVSASPTPTAGEKPENSEAGQKVASAEPATTKPIPLFGGGVIVPVVFALFGVLALLNRRRR